MNIWHDIDPKRITPTDFMALIEIPKGSKNKYELDKETGLVMLDRVLHTSTHYPANYGMIPRTYADDYDPLDVLVLCSEPLHPSTLVRCYPIGAIKMLDNGRADEKIIAIPFSDPTYNVYINGVISFVFMGGASEENPDTPNNPGDDVVIDDCFEETFDGLIVVGSTDITEMIDEYADNAGWEGYKLFCSSGMLKVGSSKAKGYVVTPALPFDGDVQVEFVGAAYKDDAVISFEIDGEVVNEFDVTSQKVTHIFDIDGLDAYSQIKIYSSDKRFYVDNFKVCKKQGVVTDVLNSEAKIVLVNSGSRAELLGVGVGAVVSCYDRVGRLLWCEEAAGDVMEFEAPRGFYVLRIVAGEKVEVVKGIGNK